MNILHVTSRKAWIDATRAGQYSAPSLEQDGFIHASTLKQVLPVASRYYKGQSGLLLLEIDPARLTSELKWEPPSGGPLPGVPEGDAFPHIYGPINLDAVIQVVDFEPDENGDFTLPNSLNRGG
ncbi:MAG: DUF952 domain-containing protein [Anaerolineales bacterium]